MTPDELPDELKPLANHPTCSAEEAISALGGHRTAGYAALRNGTFPVPAFKIGAKWLVPTKPVLELLGYRDAVRDEDPPGSDGSPIIPFTPRARRGTRSR